MPPRCSLRSVRGCTGGARRATERSRLLGARSAISGRNLSVPRARMGGMGNQLRRIGDPVVAAAPAGVRIRARIHPTAAEAAALTAIGDFLGSVYRVELAARVELGRLDGRAHAAWRAERKQALTGVASSRWAGAITRAVEDQYQLGMRGLAATSPICGPRSRCSRPRCALRPGEYSNRIPATTTRWSRRGRRRRRRGYRSAGRAVHQDPASGGSTAAAGWGRVRVGGGATVDHRGR